MKLRMIDRIISWTPKKRIHGIKTVSFEEYMLKAPFGGPPCLPESLLMESMFQLGNWLIMLSSDFRQMGLLVRTQQVRFEAPLRPGRSLSLEAEVLSYRNDGVLFDGRAFVDDVLVGGGWGCLATLVPLADYHDPDHLRVLFSEIYRPMDTRSA